MQIKRFEAADMTEALRLVKREFGDDAVILSAKEVKPGGFFSALKKRHVEITAATDYPTEETTPEKEFTGLLAQQLDEISATDRVSLSTPAPSILPVSRMHRTASRPESAADGSFAEHKPNGRRYRKQPDPSKAEAPVLKAVRHHPKRMSVEKDTHFRGHRHRESERVDGCKKPFYSHRDRKQIIALVGPSGAGKSTALAKLAWHCRRSEKQQVGLISLDRYRMAANSLLERFAKIMQLPLYVAQNTDELQFALREMASAETVLIDTPGMGPTDRSMKAAIRKLLIAAQPDEIHLVINAAVRQDVLAAAVTTYEDLNPDHILFTHLDEFGETPFILDALEEIRLPCSFLVDGVNLQEGLKATAGERTQSEHTEMASPGGQVTVFPGIRGPGNIHPDDHLPRTESARYLANRNSELFHEPTCKSVKRINTENIIAFNSLEQALSRGFKPCRACCNIDVIRKMVTDAAAVQRAGAM